MRLQVVSATALVAVTALSLGGCSSEKNDGTAPSTTGGSATGGASTASGGATIGGTSTGGTTAGGAPSAGASGAATGGTSAGSTSGGATAGGAGATSGGVGGTLGGAGSGGAASMAGSGGEVARGPCSPPLDIDAPAEKLSQTGCMDPADPRKMASFVLPYDVNSPLWSDGADKQRGLVLPPGGKIHVKNCTLEPDSCFYGPQDEGDFVFPIGSVLIKSFLFDGKLVETRLFVRFDQRTYVGYGYQWDEAQTDATIVPDETRKVTFNTGQREVEWTYPSRYDCMLCHNKPSGSVLGPEIRQLNRVQNGKNLLDTWEELALFDAPLPKPYLDPLPTPYPLPEGMPPVDATTDELARSYLHGNCGYCHRPDGDVQNLDFRWGVPFSETGACNAAPLKGGGGLTMGSLLTPGKPEESIVWSRMQTLDDQHRMPQIGTYRVDEQGLELIETWITSLTGCP